MEKLEESPPSRQQVSPVRMNEVVLCWGCKEFITEKEPF
jgi:hypothetical protein